MDNNIYQIDSWTPSTFYYKNKILTYNNLYYYVMFDYTSSSLIVNDINAGNLGGYIWDRGESKPYFQWKPNYNFENTNEPRVKNIQFGDGYSQRTPDGINNLLLNYQFSFQGDLHATTAILHFLTIRNGVESFCFIPPAPRGQIGRFVCQNWKDKQTFNNNYTISANFIQTPT